MTKTQAQRMRESAEALKERDSFNHTGRNGSYLLEIYYSAYRGGYYARINLIEETTRFIWESTFVNRGAAITEGEARLAGLRR